MPIVEGDTKRGHCPWLAIGRGGDAPRRGAAIAKTRSKMHDERRPEAKQGKHVGSVQLSSAFEQKPGIHSGNRKDNAMAVIRYVIVDKMHDDAKT
eukprot:5966021-Pleurochrysis_carterae.AAC.1